MKTIAFCNSTLAWGGGENWHLEAALYLAEQGYTVLMMAHERGALYSRAKKHEGPNFTVVPLSIGRLSFLNPLTVGKYARFLTQNQVQTVLMNLPQDLKCMGLAAQKAKIPHIIYRRGSALPVKDSLLNRYLYGKVLTGLIVNSQATKKEVYRNNPRLIPEERVMVLSNGIDIEGFERRLAAARPLDGFEETTLGALKKRPIVLGNAGRLNKQKGQHFLLYLAKSLDVMQVDYRLVIAGAGERREELEVLSHRLGVADKVVFSGFLQDTCPFWKSIDIFVLTSLWEGFGYVLLEAMLSEKPIVAFGVSNIPELVEDGENGFLLPLPVSVAGKDEGEDVPDMGPMAEAVRRLAHEADLRQRMGQAGRAFAKPTFDQQAVMGQLLAYLEKGDV